MNEDNDLHEGMTRRASEAGLLVAAASVPETFQRTLIPRSDFDQALVSGLTFTLNHGIVSTIHEALQTVALPGDADHLDVAQWHRRTMIVDVAWFHESLLVRRPSWLGPVDTRPRQVPRSPRWVPVTTFIQTLIDMKNAAQVVPGVFASRGHDYRADLPPMFAGVLGLPASGDQLRSIRRALEAEEAVRTRWIDEHGEVGASMASSLLRRIREESPEAYDHAARSLGQDVEGWTVEWENRDAPTTP